MGTRVAVVDDRGPGKTIVADDAGENAVPGGGVGVTVETSARVEVVVGAGLTEVETGFGTDAGDVTLAGITGVAVFAGFTGVAAFTVIAGVTAFAGFAGVAAFAGFFVWAAATGRSANAGWEISKTVAIPSRIERSIKTSK